MDVGRKVYNIAKEKHRKHVNIMSFQGYTNVLIRNSKSQQMRLVKDIISVILNNFGVLNYK